MRKSDRTYVPKDLLRDRGDWNRIVQPNQNRDPHSNSMTVVPLARDSKDSCQQLVVERNGRWKGSTVSVKFRHLVRHKMTKWSP
jgi:hypothetical protein